MKNIKCVDLTSYNFEELRELVIFLIFEQRRNGSE
jgi:hypothetical protein